MKKLVIGIGGMGGSPMKIKVAGVAGNLEESATEVMRKRGNI